MNKIQKIIDNITDLPTLPDVVSRINEMVHDPSTSAAEINDVISRDLALSTKVLKLVNSPFYGFPRRITNITYAVVILGFNTIRNLALSAFMFDLFKTGVAGFDLQAFWRYSIASAVGSQLVAKRAGFELIEDAFMGGLLHDVGKVIMNQYLKKDFEAVVKHVQEQDCLFLEAEEAVLDYTHHDIGAALLERWNLPPHLVESCRLYHKPCEGADESCFIPSIHLADILVRALCFGSPGDRRIPKVDPQAWSRLNIPVEGLEPLMDAILLESTRASAFFEMAQ